MILMAALLHLVFVYYKGTALLSLLLVIFITSKKEEFEIILPRCLFVHRCVLHIPH